MANSHLVIKDKLVFLQEYKQHYLIQEQPRIVNASRAEEPVKWPDSRNLATIEKLYQVSFASEIKQLPDHAKILDVGPGRGVLVSELKQHNLHKSFIVEGISTTQVDQKNLHNFNTLTYFSVPESQDWLERRRGFFDFTFDTYASLTYAKNPLHALIYLLLAIAPKGKLYAMSSLTPGDNENSCFGDTVTRAKIVEFLQKKLGVILHFDLVKIQSTACKPGELMDDLRIHCQIPANGLQLSAEYPSLTWKLFKQLCELADKEIGVPKLMANKTSFAAGHYHITPRHYG